MTQGIMDTQQVCFLHKLVSILEPVTCQEVSRLGTISLQSQTLLLDFRGCTAESLPCDGMMPWGFPPSPQNSEHWVADCHHSTATSMARAVRWVARTGAPSQPPHRVLVFPGCRSHPGGALHVCCNLPKWEHSPGSAGAACLSCCSQRLLSSLFCCM